MNLSGEYFNKPLFSARASTAHTLPLPSEGCLSSHQGTKPAEGLDPILLPECSCASVFFPLALGGYNVEDHAAKLHVGL